MNNELLQSKIGLVMDRLIHLGGADYDADKNVDAGEAIKSGNIARDFGIEEWDWPQGVGLYGLSMLQDYYGDDRFMEFYQSWFRTNVAQGLPSRNVNTTMPYLTLLSILDRIPEPERTQYENLCLTHADWIMTDLPRTRDGGFQHVTSAIGNRNGVILNEGQLWADTLFMVVLFLQRMGIRYHRADWEAEATHQFLVHIKYLYNKANGLFYHGWSFERNDNFGGVFWCRGNSWFTLGVTLFLEHAENLDAGTRQFLVDTFRAHVETLSHCQGPKGLFYTVLDDPTSYEEASGTAAMAAGILRGIRMGILSEDYRDCAARAIEGLCDCVAEDGTVLQVSAGTGMGMDKDHYRNVNIHPMAYGQSLTLIALVEALEG